MNKTDNIKKLTWKCRSLIKKGYLYKSQTLNKSDSNNFNERDTSSENIVTLDESNQQGDDLSREFGDFTTDTTQPGSIDIEQNFLSNGKAGQQRPSLGLILRTDAMSSLTAASPAITSSEVLNGIIIGNSSVSNCTMMRNRNNDEINSTYSNENSITQKILLNEKVDVEKEMMVLPITTSSSIMFESSSNNSDQNSCSSMSKNNTATTTAYDTSNKSATGSRSNNVNNRQRDKSPEHTITTYLIQMFEVRISTIVSRKGYLNVYDDKGSQTWKRRYLIVRRPYIFIYREERDCCERGIINLAHSTLSVVPSSRESSKKGDNTTADDTTSGNSSKPLATISTTFSIKCRHHIYLIQTANEKELYDWLNAIDPLLTGKIKSTIGLGGG